MDPIRLTALLLAIALGSITLFETARAAWDGKTEHLVRAFACASFCTPLVWFLLVTA